MNKSEEFLEMDSLVSWAEATSSDSRWREVQLVDASAPDITEKCRCTHLTHEHLKTGGGAPYVGQKKPAVINRFKSYIININDSYSGANLQRSDNQDPIDRVRQLSIYSGVIAPVAVGQISQMFLRSGKLRR